MKSFINFFISLILLSIIACQPTEKKQQSNLFDFVPPQTSYIIKINKAGVLNKHNPVILDTYLNQNDKHFLSNMNFDKAFNINILQNNSKIKGFIAVGKTQVLDSIFNGETTEYETQNIYSQVFKKQNYYATKINGVSFISNQKLFIEKCIREKENLNILAKNQDFRRGINSLDTQADMNIISLLKHIKPDLFYKSVLKIKLQDIGDWQFFDLVETDKQIATGITITTDSLSAIKSIFNDVKPQNNNFASLIPFAVDETVMISFDDFEKFLKRLSENQMYAPQLNTSRINFLNELNAIGFFVENKNKAMLFQFDNFKNYFNEEPEKLKDFNNYEIFFFPYSKQVNNIFSNILPEFTSKFFTQIDDVILLTESQAYMEKILNDIQNHSVLQNNETFKKLRDEITGDYHLMLFKNKIQIKGQKYMWALTFKVDDDIIFNDLVLKPFDNRQQTPVEQVMSYSLNNLPNTDPQLVYNHKSKSLNIIFQDDENRLNLLNLNGKTLWQTALKDQIIGKIKQVDILRNRKLQYTFVTPHHWYVIDRLGRNVEKFPQYFMQKITQGISVFDYSKNRKYRFGITQSNKFRLFDNDAKKVKGFKIKTDENIIRPPQHFRISNKDFIQMQDETGKLYLLNRRGAKRIKISQKFGTKRNNWGVFNKKFVNIDDNDRLIAIGLSGKIKTGNLTLGKNILSDIRLGHLAAVSGNKLLIDKKIIELDLGSYGRPHIFKTKNKIYIFIANEDNDRIYAYDTKGNLLKNFPIIGHQILDFKTNKGKNYLLVYDRSKNLVLYKF